MLAVIPARAGSKGIPRKNVRPFLGKPLLVWAVEVALASEVFDRVVVSTDEEEIAELGRSAGAEAPFLRPPELAADETPTAPVVRHALDELGESPKHVLVVEPTSPARQPFHLREAADLLVASGADSVASVSAVPHHFDPAKQLRLAADGTIAGQDGTPVAELSHRRQELSTLYAFDGIVFGCRAELVRRDPPTLWGERVVGYVVDPRYAIDLDRREDWAAAEARVRDLLAAEAV
jgi:CMP-N,N'-diacetyllegionaminic acid synthase